MRSDCYSEASQYVEMLLTALLERAWLDDDHGLTVSEPMSEKGPPQRHSLIF